MIATTTLANVGTVHTYNPFGELATFTAGTLYSEDVSLRDDLGRIERKVETLGGVATPIIDYEYYPDTGRLKTVSEGGTPVRTYTYDDNGNRLSYVHGNSNQIAFYDEQDRLMSYDTATYTYTANGELDTKIDGPDTTDYDYDTLGNLTQVTLPDNRIISYVIDGRNRRVGKQVDGALVQGFLYRDALNPVAELNAAGTVVARFVYATKPNVPDYMVKGGATYRILSDHLGSVRLVVNASDGSVAQRIDYDEFGNVTSDTNPGFQPFGFAGGLYDVDTGLVRFGARDYDPEVGRWTAKDPIRFAGGSANLYEYALGDPINVVDADGLRFLSVGGRASFVPGFGGELGAGFYIGFHEGDSRSEGLGGGNFDMGFYGTAGLGVGLEAAAGFEAGTVEEISGAALNLNVSTPLAGFSVIFNPEPCEGGFGSFVSGFTASSPFLKLPGIGGGGSLTLTGTATTTDLLNAATSAISRAFD